VPDRTDFHIFAKEFVMLVLSRKEGERLVIDGNIVVTVVRLAGGKVRLGIEAPAEVSVRREELQPLPAASRSSSSGLARQPECLCFAAQK
jgi:carbon storage regulator